ncbi:hypothetical protein RB595_001518 [Gaeumannomyces hyphopodioides]
MIPRTPPPPLAAVRLSSRRPAHALPGLHLLPRTAQQQQRRHGSSSPQPSHTSNFYKTFGRPVFKVSLSAIFVYQLVYWAWVKLEQDEIMGERRDLEAQVESLQASRATSKQTK